MNTGGLATPSPGGRLNRGLAATVTALALAGVLVGCSSGGAVSAPRSTLGGSRYQSLYVGLASLDTAQPPVLAQLTLGLIERTFPPTSTFKPRTSLFGDLFVGLTLGRLSCRNYYLAKVRYAAGGGPLTLVVAQQALPAGHACFELIGPPRYQVLALPRARFPSNETLSILVTRPLGQNDRTSITLP